MWQHICYDWFTNFYEIPVKLYIRNISGSPSERVISSLLEAVGFHPVHIQGGEVEITEDISTEKFRMLRNLLRRNHFEILIDKTIILTEKIRNLIIDMIHYSPELPAVNYSDYISSQLQANYTLLSKSFSKISGITIEQFIISQKIERVKKLLAQQEITLSEIARKLRYSSTAHLSNQFKRITGLTPSRFRKLKSKIDKHQEP